MALEAVVFPQDPLNYNGNKDLYSLFGGGNWISNIGLELDFLENQTENDFPFNKWNSSPSSVSVMVPNVNHLEGESRSRQIRPRRRRIKSRKNKEEIENQRMTHIAVERNRRKQMNEYLSVLRSLMPDSYIQRGDQASIIGGAINYVKELEQKVQILSTVKTDSEGNNNNNINSIKPFSEFFSFPQFTAMGEEEEEEEAEGEGERECSIADIEVTMVENHANLKIRSKKRPKQLLKMVAGLHSLFLTVLHLNISTIDQIVLYSLSVKVEDDCKLNSVDEIATALHQLLTRIEEESLLN